MGKWDRFRDQLLGGNADQNIGFSQLISYLKRLGLEERIEGGHHIYTHESMAEIINLQPGRAGKAKPYQVKQVRAMIEQYGLGAEAEEQQKAEGE